MAQGAKTEKKPTHLFTSENLKGNQNAKKCFTKEMAKHIVSQDLYRLSKFLCEFSSKEVEEYFKKHSGDLSVMSKAILKKAIAGDIKSIQFFIEMTIGKALPGEIDIVETKAIQINIDKDDAEL